MTEYRIGIDVGGTFTDGTALDDRGQEWAAKVPSTPPFFVEGILNCVDALASEVGISHTQLLQQCNLLINGTTAVTNAIVQLAIAKTGLITTRGFRDVMRIAKGGQKGSFRPVEPDITKYVPIPEVVKYENTVEVDERVDHKGDILVPLNRDQVKQVVKDLVENKGVEAVAVSLLWSFKNPAHEQQIKAVIKEMYPNLTVCISSEVRPIIREYERTMTTVLNAAVSPILQNYVGGLEGRVKEWGYQFPFYLMHSAGGYSTVEESLKSPISLAGSGPVGGVIGANTLGKMLGQENVLAVDTGGTTFDISLIVNNEYSYDARTWLGRFLTGLTTVSVTSIGAGGGSIAWLDPRGLLKVGPRSAGARPGPACYGQGGSEPTLTDAFVLMDLLNPEFFLGGKIKLNKELAASAMAKVAGQLGWDLNATSSGVYKVLVANAAEAMRSVSIAKGYEPTGFTVLAYGGSSALIIAEVCKILKVKNVIMPQFGPVFSAWGLLRTDYQRKYVQSYNYRAGRDIGPINQIFADLTAKVRSDFAAAGIKTESTAIFREADIRYVGQFNELTIPVSSETLTEQDVAGPLYQEFEKKYEGLYGKGTVWTGGEIEIINVRVTGVSYSKPVPMLEAAIASEDPSSSLKGARKVFLPYVDSHETVPIYDGDRIRPGMSIKGPALVEGSFNTVYVPQDVALHMDGRKNLLMSF
ncbi:MAG: hydantoinase/oxoprolinase family protein [Chloroflexota bacterium]|nr:MAG: hydantoinase/oxoprolinase family protein [Chloroflexota bacterium]